MTPGGQARTLALSNPRDATCERTNGRQTRTPPAEELEAEVKKPHGKRPRPRKK
jgi:hypothetical protein